MGTVDIFVGNNLIIDFDIYVLWINGFSVEECKEQIMRKDPLARETPEHIVIKDVIDNYFVFNKLEQYLHSPPRLKEQLSFQITDIDCDKLIEKYYYYDVSVMREFLGLKLSQRQRKELDDVCEKTGCRVKSCRRQFDNLKRIVRHIEDMRGPLVKNIIDNFCLPNKLAENYAAIVFIIKNQFEVSKRKLNHISLDDFIYCANQMIKNWSSMFVNTETESELSRDFLMNLKDLKLIIDKDFIDDHKKLVMTGLSKNLNTNQLHVKDNRALYALDHSFKDLSKGLIDIAYALNHSKDMKDIFVDLMERFIEPCKEHDYSKNEVKLFLEEYRKRAHQLHDICRDNPKFLSVFDRYILTITSCIIQMYHS